jgi:hypothetical protein
VNKQASSLPSLELGDWVPSITYLNDETDLFSLAIGNLVLGKTTVLYCNLEYLGKHKNGFRFKLVNRDEL